MKIILDDYSDSISGDKHRLLESIFSWEEDIVFLKSQPGYHAGIGTRHQAAKRRLAFQWIRELQKEFEKLCAQGRVLLVQSDRDRSDLVQALFRLQFSFRKRVLFLKLRILWKAPALEDVRLLTTALEHLIAYHCIIEEDVALLN